MTTGISNKASRAEKIIRWIARVWSLLIFGFALTRVFTPDPYATEPIKPADILLLSLWGLAIIGLIVAFRWERLGAIIAIGVMLIRELVWIIIYGDWIINFLIIWAVIIPPAVLFWFAWSL